MHAHYMAAIWFYNKCVTSSLGPAKTIIVAFEAMIGQNSRMDCARNSVKTSLDSEESSRSDEFKKRNFTFEN